MEKRYLSIVETSGEILTVDYWRLEHKRTSPCDSLVFSADRIPEEGADITLKFGLQGQIRTIFDGKLYRRGSRSHAVDRIDFFSPITPFSYTGTTVHAIVRDLCERTKIANPEINCRNFIIPHFRVETNICYGLSQLVKLMLRIGYEDAGDITFFLDPAGKFYFGGFKNWKQEIEVIGERENLINLEGRGKEFVAEVTPMEVYHSQQVRMIHSRIGDAFHRVENVLWEFENGEHRQYLYLKPS